MSQSYTTRSGITLKIPGTYVEQSVIAGQGGIGVAGVIAIIGEANEGPQWSDAEDLSAYSYAPNQLSAAIRAFGSGPIVDAFKAAISANADSNIAGSVNRVFLVKTNASVKALADVLRAGLGTYAQIRARKAGKPGNLISFKNTTSTAEVAPQIANISLFLHPSLSTTLQLRINGAAEVGSVVSAIAASLPDSLADQMTADWETEGALAQGGLPRNAIPSGVGTLSAADDGDGNLVITLSAGAWATNPSANDVLIIHTASSIAGAGGENVGSWRVISATATTVVASPVNVTGPAIDPVVGAIQDAGSTRAFDSFSAITLRNATGMDRDILADVTGNLTSSNFTASSVKLSLDAGVKFAAKAQVGELVYVPADSIGVLQGWYQISASSNETTGQLTLSRLSNGALANAPASVAVAAQLVALKSDIDGVGKSMELLSDDDSAAIVKNSLNGNALSELDALVTSSAERKVQTQISVPGANNPVTETYLCGGDIVMTMGYAGDTCVVTITDAVLSTVCSETADNLTIQLADYPRLSTLVDFINSNPKYSATLPDSRWSAVAPAKLDNVVTAIASSVGANPGRLKKDADDWMSKLSASAFIETPTYGSSGLPDAESSFTFLASGAKGATSGADVVAAIDACETIACNFVVTCFDRDSADDIADKITEPASTYEIDAINAYARTHAVAMSEVLNRKNRMAVVAKWTTRDGAFQAARDLTHPRVAMTWYKTKDAALDGTTKTFPAWYSSAKAAGLQAAAGYKGIVKKLVNQTGVVYPAGFDPRKRADLEDALTAGLLIVEPVSTGGFRYVSDQTTYNIDNNFVYNSMQAVYIADLMTLTLIQNGDRVLVGKSVAQISASIARGFMQTELSNFLRLNWIAKSNDAALGYKNLSVKLTGGVIEIEVEVKLAGIIYFVPISLAFSEVTQTA